MAVGRLILDSHRDSQVVSVNLRLAQVGVDPGGVNPISRVLAVEEQTSRIAAEELGIGPIARAVVERVSAAHQARKGGQPSAIHRLAPAGAVRYVLICACSEARAEDSCPNSEIMKSIWLQLKILQHCYFFSSTIVSNLKCQRNNLTLLIMINFI